MILFQTEQAWKHRLETSEDSLNSTLTKLATKVQQFERESARRDSLEKQVELLTHQLDEDRHELQRRHEVDLERRQREWHEARNELLTLMQHECNQVFDHRRRHYHHSTTTTRLLSPTALLSSTGRKSTSPTSVASSKEFFPAPGSSTATASGSPSFKVDTALANAGGTNNTASMATPSRTARPSPSAAAVEHNMAATTMTVSDMDSVLRETEALVASLL